MKIWIEVSTEYRFKQKLDNVEGLYAPATTRYKNMIRPVSSKDTIVHYITGTGSIKKEIKSSIIGISKVKSDMIIDGSKIRVDLSDVYTLPKPINIKLIKSLNNKSALLHDLFKINFQRYLSQISQEDLFHIIRIHLKNYNFISNNKDYQYLFY